MSLIRTSSHPRCTLSTTTMSTTSLPPSSIKPYDVDITIVSAKHLKNVNWRHGELKPYVIFWVDPDRRLATKSDDSGSTGPVWNERFTFSLSHPHDSLLTLEIFHSKPSETAKPLVGTLRVQLRDLIDSDESMKLRTFELRRPSGRPQGKIRLKLSFRERVSQDYHITPPPYIYSTAHHIPALSPTRDYRGYSPSPYTSSLPPPPPTPPTYSYGAYSDPYNGYYSGYFSLPPPRPFLERPVGYGGGSHGPSAPVDYGYDKNGKVGGVVAGIGGLTLEDEKEEKVGSDGVVASVGAASSRDDYGDYHRGHY